MSIDKETIKKIAHLARLEFDEKEADKMSDSFNKILAWMDKLNEVNTDNVEPLIHMSDEVNVLREDVVNNSLKHDEALLNAPKKDSDYFRVPKFLG
ncbi:MAG TPA: Asp-tRNA(Asn)/Glu-tRNA(Gln) amidotransferase subunit GatC [Cytophagaceae bacterium]|jgi:aspartyl-tRNA(Asn)/glutamyl-tRNA(Gln) amidotransferase subunit C|nr:Asp-tRNA(Asn)/Glu-tRNA(Gln) amidotransferase subunit GatC [Cytophagaceae bacterium]